MTAYTDFQNSIASAKSLTEMYKELRRFRNLGQRGALTAANEDLLWLPRSAVVSAVSAMDAYIHAVIADKLPGALASQNIPTSLADLVSELIPIKNAQTFKSTYPLISVANLASSLVMRIQSEKLSFVSYQAPEKVIEGYKLIGYEGIFGSVSNIWPGPNTTEKDIKDILVKYVKRRNQIAHEGDREASGAVRHMQPKYANDCANFVSNLVLRLNRVVYGVPA
jgi:hypothetical protein